MYDGISMTHLLYRLTLLLVLLTGMSACNNDVFVKPLKLSASQVELSEETRDVSVTVEGEAWELYSVFSEELDMVDGSYDYYDAEGNRVTGYWGDMSQLTCRYVYNKYGIEFWVTRKPFWQGLDISLKQYQYGKPLHLKVIVGNEYGSESINVTLR